MKLLREYIREFLVEKETRGEKTKRTLYHINKRPAAPQPKMTYLRMWDRDAVDPDTGERTGDMVTVPGTDVWKRHWLDSPVKSGVFLTPNPVDIAQFHGRSGNVYAYKVPEWVINKSGGIHRYDSGSELLIPEDVWNEAGDEIEFLGKSMDRDELWDQIDSSLFGRGHTRKATRPSWLSDEERAAWEKRQSAFNLSGLRATRHPEDVIKMLTGEEQRKAIEAIEAATETSWSAATKDEELLTLLKKHLKESALRKIIRSTIQENVLAVGMCFPFAAKKAEEWFEQHFEARRGRAPKRHPDLNNKDKFKVVHGKVTDQWKNPPKPIVHAWVEMGDLVFDDQTKHTKPDGVPKDVYYEMYQPEIVEEYTAEEAVVNCDMKGEGPWNPDLIGIMRQRDAWMNESYVVSSDIIIPPPPGLLDRIKELPLISTQRKMPFNSSESQYFLDKKVSKLFDAIIKNAGYNSHEKLIKRIKNEVKPVIKMHKDFFNAKRPNELADSVGLNFDYDYLESAQSPSYPSGHTTQAFYLAHKLSPMFPELEVLFYKLANMVAESRVDRGVHFPSDNVAGKILADKLANKSLKESRFKQMSKTKFTGLKQVLLNSSFLDADPEADLDDEEWSSEAAKVLRDTLNDYFDSNFQPGEITSIVKVDMLPTDSSAGKDSVLKGATYYFDDGLHFIEVMLANLEDGSTLRGVGGADQKVYEVIMHELLHMQQFLKFSKGNPTAEKWNQFKDAYEKAGGSSGMGADYFFFDDPSGPSELETFAFQMANELVNSLGKDEAVRVLQRQHPDHAIIRDSSASFRDIERRSDVNRPEFREMLKRAKQYAKRM